ncbi:MAG TPA: dihydrofolate reductase [Chloroflexi bacterium]|nr:dihydrofolate reductase [Chloroflexota bacterium]
MTYAILVSAPYLLPVFERFEPIFRRRDIEVIRAGVRERLEEQALLQFAGQVDGVICGDDRFSARVLEAFAPRLRVIAKWGTGIDSIDLHATEELGIQVHNTPSTITEAVADSVMAYMLAFARRTPWLDQAMKRGEWKKLPGRALHECILGVIGVGNIGKAVLRRAQAFGMQLMGNDILEIDPEFIAEVGVEMVDLETLLRSADFISLNCDLNPTSRHLIDEQRLALVKSTAVLINTARGSVVEERAMIRALQDGRLAGAGLDVYEDEPLPADSPLLGMDQVLLAPHNANSSPAAWERVHRNTINCLLGGLGLEPAREEEFAEGLRVSNSKGGGST